LLFVDTPPQAERQSPIKARTTTYDKARSFRELRPRNPAMNNPENAKARGPGVDIELREVFTVRSL